MAKVSKAKAAVAKHDEALKKALDRYKESWDYQEAHWHHKWDRDSKLYNNERVHAQYHGVTDTFVPMTFSTIETMVAALNNANLRFDFKSNDPLRQTSPAPLNALVDEWWDDDQWDLALEEGERETLKIGMAAFMFSWEMNQPHLDHFAMRDAITDPTIKNPAQLQKPGAYAGRRYRVRREALEEIEVIDTDEESDTYGEVVKRYNLPAHVELNKSADTEEDDKTHQEMLAGSTVPNAPDQHEIIEIWTVDDVVTVMDRTYVIENVENPYKARHRQILMQEYKEQGVKDYEKQAKQRAKGLVPFFFLRNYRQISLFYAKSEIDSIAKLQENLNDHRNMESDAIIRQLSPQKELDPAYSDWIDLIDNEPDTTYPFKPGSLVDRPVAVVPANSFNSQQNIKNEMREATAVDQLAKGIANIRPTTATEVNEQVESTSQRIESKARIFEKDGLYWMAYIVFRFFQLYVTQPMVVEVKGQDANELRSTFTGPNGEEIQLPPGAVILDPKDYRGDWRPKVMLEIDAKAKKADEQRAAKENYQIMIADPTNDLGEAKQIMYPKMFDLTKDEIDRILTPPKDGNMGATDAMGGQLPADGAMPAGGAMTEELPVDPAMAQASMDQPEGDIDTAALETALTPEELQQLQSFLQQGAMNATV